MLSRRKARILVVQSLYAWEVNKVPVESLLQFSWCEGLGKNRDAKLVYSRYLLSGIIENCADIDIEIQRKLKDWDITRLGWVELAILRLGVFELLWLGETPRQVVINEAIEIANVMASPNAFRIINGVLDAIQPKDL